VAGQDQGDRTVGAGIGLILEELRDLRLEMRADRARADADRARVDEERRQAEARFDRLIRDFREDTARREAATQRAFRDIRTGGWPS